MKQRKPKAAAIAKARALYDEGETPLAEIAAMLKLGRAAFLSLRKSQGWPSRGRGRKQAAITTPAAAPEPDRPDEPVDTNALKRRLAGALRREIARVESELENVAPPGAERKARILASLVKTLADLRRLDEASKPNDSEASDERRDGAPPRDLATLRQALVDRLEDLRGQRDAG